MEVEYVGFFYMMGEKIDRNDSDISTVIYNSSVKANLYNTKCL